MINILGIILIILGTLWPFHHGLIPGVHRIILWFGILSILSPGILIPKNINWNRWARAGFLAYILITFIHIIYYYSVFTSSCYPELRSYSILYVLNWIAGPFSSLLLIIFSCEILISSKDIYIFRFAEIGNIIIYLVAGILIGKFHETCKKILKSR